MTNTTKPKRRWYQYRLRTLMLLMFVAALGLGWVGWKVQRIRSELKATAELERLEAHIGFHEDQPLPDSLPYLAEVCKPLLRQLVVYPVHGQSGT